MWLRLSVLLLLLSLIGAFPADNAQTLRERYGRPISETYQVRPGIVASARYGDSGRVCEILLHTPEPSSLIKSSPRKTIGDDKEVAEVLDEIVPVSERGKLLQGVFVNLQCPPDDCLGGEEVWERMVIYRNGHNGSEHYVTIQWRREDCPPTDGPQKFGAPPPIPLQ
jgi:hypothetical protein